MDNATVMESLLERVEDYGKTTVELFKLNALKTSADVASSFVSRLVVLIAVVLSVLIINIGIALWIGQLLANAFFGFFIVGGFYAIVALLLHTFRDAWIKNPVNDSIVAQILSQRNHETNKPVQ